MRRFSTLIGFALLVLSGVVLALGDRAVGPALDVFVALLAIGGVAIAGWKLLGGPDDSDRSILRQPWTDEGALFETAPERTPDEQLLSGESFAAVLAEAGETARDEGSVEAGYETVRPVLRRVLVDALVFREGSRSAAEATIEDGSWTEDPVAAAVLVPAIERPEWPLRRRIEAWLFPERIVRTQLQRTVQAIARTAETAIPNVPGQNAPQSVPVVRPRLEDLQRGVDGRIQRAVDPLATADGPHGPDGDVPTDVVESGGLDDSEQEPAGAAETETMSEAGGARSSSGESGLEPSDDQGRDLFLGEGERR